LIAQLDMEIMDDMVDGWMMLLLMSMIMEFHLKINIHTWQDSKNA